MLEKYLKDRGEDYKISFYETSSPSRVITFLNELLSNKTVTHVLFNYYKITDREEVIALSNVLKSNRNLKNIFLEQSLSKINDDDLELILNSLNDSTIEVLDIRYLNLKNLSAIALGNLLATNKTIKTLYLNDAKLNLLSEEVLKYLFDGLSSNTSIEHIVLGGIKITPNIARYLGAALARNKVIKKIYLNNMQLEKLTASELKPLLEGIARNTSINSISCLSNIPDKEFIYFGDKEKEEALINCIKANYNIIEFEFDNSISYISRQEFENYIKRNIELYNYNLINQLKESNDKPVESVVFKGPGITPNVIKALGEVLAKNKTLKTLNLSSIGFNELTVEEFKPLLEGIAKNNSIEYLVPMSYVWGGRYYDNNKEFEKDLIHYLSKNTSIIFCNLCRYYSDEASEQLYKIEQRNKKFKEQNKIVTEQKNDSQFRDKSKKSDFELS